MKKNCYGSATNSESFPLSVITRAYTLRKARGMSREYWRPVPSDSEELFSIAAQLAEGEEVVDRARHLERFSLLDAGVRANRRQLEQGSVMGLQDVVRLSITAINATLASPPSSCEAHTGCEYHGGGRLRINGAMEQLTAKEHIKFVEKTIEMNGLASTSPQTSERLLCFF